MSISKNFDLKNIFENDKIKTNAQNIIISYLQKKTSIKRKFFDNYFNFQFQ